MKKILFLTLLLSLFIFPNLLKADETNYYVNRQNVKIDNNTYEKLCNIYSEQYVEFLTEEEYRSLIEDNLENVEVVSSNDSKINLFSFSSDYNGRNVKLIKNNTKVTLITKWNKKPALYSHDVIAVRLSGPSISGSVLFKQTYYNTNGILVSNYDSSNQVFGDGYGSSFKLLAGTNNEISLTFNVNGSGTIYGTYQHAIQNTTLQESKDYTLSYLGYGGVINFSPSVRLKYDAMSGVDIRI